MKTFLTVAILAFTFSVNATVPFLDSTDVSFERDIRPVFKSSCTSCHNGSNNLPNITDYKVAFSLRHEIVKRVSTDKTMPMYKQLSESNRELVKRWVDQGAKK